MDCIISEEPEYILIPDTTIKAKIDSVMGLWKMVKKRKTGNMDGSESELKRWIKPWAPFR